MSILPYFVSIPLILFAALKAIQRKQEWVVVLLIMSSATSSIVQLFLGQSVFTLFWIGTLQFHVDDIVLIFLSVYCFIWMVKSPRITKPLVLFIALIILPLAISLLRGLLAGAFPSSMFIADTRTYGYFVLPLFTLYIMARDKKRAGFLKSIVYIHRFMNCLAAFLVLIWILDLFFGLNSLPGQLDGLQSDGGSTFRIISKSLATIMALYVYMLAYDDFRKGDALRWKTVFFSILIILLQWRVVQYAFIFGCFLLLLRKVVIDKKISVRLIIQALSILAVFFIAPILLGRTALLASSISALSSGHDAAPLASQLSSSVADATASLTSVANNTGTYATRTQAWDMILDSLSGIDLLLGQPFGTPYAESVAWLHSSHSQYVSVIFKEGYLGLLCFITFLSGMIVSAVRRHLWLVAICLAYFIIYFYTENAGVLESAVLGVCLGILEWPRRNDPDNEEAYGTD